MPIHADVAAEDLLERRAELEQIAVAIRGATAEEGSLLAFEGPAGIGKTQLLEIARADAGEAGLRVLTARAGELERDFAYGIVRQLLERPVAATDAPTRAALLDGPAVHAGLALGIGALGPGERPADDPAFAVRHGLYWLVANLAAQGPLVLAVDDAQWADAPSLRFLAYLARRLDGLGVLVVLTVRTGDPGTDDALLAEVLGGPEVVRMIPGALTLEATGELVARDTRQPVDGAFVAACHAATGGNPFLLRELRGALRDDGVAPVAANVRRVEGLGPRTVARSLLLRLTRISPAAVSLARAVSVVGSAVDPHHAGTVAGLDERAADDAYDGLARAGILATERPLRFTHPILRDAVYRDLAPSVRDGLHLRAAESLRRHAAPPSEIAAHVLATPPSNDPEVVQLLRDAATLALGQGAADVAARYLRRALEEPPPPGVRSAVLGDLGRATWLAGDDPLGALAHLRGALDADPAEDARTALTLALARATFSTGNAEGAVEIVRQELARDSGARDRQDTLALEAELGSIRLLYDITPELGAHIMSFADLPGDTTAELLVLANVGAYTWTDGTAADTATYAERSLGGGRAVQAAGSDSIAILQAAWVLSYAEVPEVAQHTIDLTIEDARRTGSVFGLTSSAAMNALLAYRNGDMARAEAEARKGMAVPGLPPFAHPTLHTFLALPLIERGELDEADAVVAASWVGPHLPVLTQMNPTFWSLGRLRLAQGRHAEALEALLEGLDRDRRLNIRNPGVPWRLDAALAASALGDHDQAVALVAAHEPDARRWGTHGALGAWLHARGLLERDEEQAQATLRDAISTLEVSPARLDHARAVVDLGALLRRAGERIRARDTLTAGLELARVCGATALVRRAHDELLVAGARPRRLQFSGAESLTASERRVCELAATGSTNRAIAQELFVTPKTVENQLGRAYAKLGISSRDQLGSALGVGADTPRSPTPAS